jgi:hypothetical protein
MTGYLHVMVPHAKFELFSGRDDLVGYRFGTGAAEHLFCRKCGIKSFYQPRSHPGSFSLNANCFDQSVELSINEFDGADWEAAKANLDAQH